MTDCPSIGRQLRNAAWRIVTDGQQHSRDATAWAHRLLTPISAEERRPDFTPRELSLGAQPW